MGIPDLRFKLFSQQQKQLHYVIRSHLYLHYYVFNTFFKPFLLSNKDKIKNGERKKKYISLKFFISIIALQWIKNCAGLTIILKTTGNKQLKRNFFFLGIFFAFNLAMFTAKF